MKTIFAFGSQKRILQDYNSQLKEPLKIGIKHALKSSLEYGFSIIISYSIFSIAFLIGEHFHSKGWI